MPFTFETAELNKFSLLFESVHPLFDACYQQWMTCGYCSFRLSGFFCAWILDIIWMFLLSLGGSGAKVSVAD